MMLGFLLARAGIAVMVLEKHADFLRDFRGDTVHPSTLRTMLELGLLEDFLKLPHERLEHLDGQFGKERYASPTSAACPRIWLHRADAAVGFPAIFGRERAQIAAAEDLDGRAETREGPLEIRAPLSVGADGRRSTVRELAGFIGKDLGAPIDVLWFPREVRTREGARSAALVPPRHALEQPAPLARAHRGPRRAAGARAPPRRSRSVSAFRIHAAQIGLSHQ
jgi:2-polyprenyl-6-methoxyphenol hydroxylase-like FAD-dependent oxidoreductase